MIDNFNVGKLLQIEERIVVPTVYLLCVVIIFVVSTLIDARLIKKNSLLKNQNDIIYKSNVIVLPIQFLFLYKGFELLFYTYHLSLIYIPLIILCSLICSAVKSLILKKHIDKPIFKKMFFTNIISTLVWMTICSVTIVQLAYYFL